MKKNNVIQSKTNSTLQLKKSSVAGAPANGNPYNHTADGLRSHNTSTQKDAYNRPAAPSNGRSSNSRSQMRSRNTMMQQAASHSVGTHPNEKINTRINPQKTINPYNEKRIASGKSN